jgi:hypothetical protein
MDISFLYNYFFWLILLILIFFVLWFLYGGQDHEFIGIDDFNSIFCGATQNNYSIQEVKIEVPEICPVRNSNAINDYRRDNPPNTERKRNAQSKGEKRCCEVMEELFGLPFITIRPDWLNKNYYLGGSIDRRNNMEIDCYNESLGIGVEYNGIQHYVWPNFTGQTYEEFKRQIERDQLKVDLCDRHGVYLITVPYKVPLDEIKDYITYWLPASVQERNNKQQHVSIVVEEII